MGLNSSSLLAQMPPAQATFSAIPIEQTCMLPGDFLGRKEILIVRCTCESSLSLSPSKDSKLHIQAPKFLLFTPRIQKNLTLGRWAELLLGSHWLVHGNYQGYISSGSAIEKISYKVCFGFYYEKNNEGKTDSSVSKVLTTQALRLDSDP